MATVPFPSSPSLPMDGYPGAATKDPLLTLLLASRGSSWSTIHTGAEDSHLGSCCVYLPGWKYMVSSCRGLEVYACGGWGCMVHVAMCVHRTICSRRGCLMSCSVTCLSLKPGTRLASKPLKSCCLFHTLTPMAQGLEVCP